MNRQDLAIIQKLLLKIPCGRVVTYQILAKAIGKPKNARYVGYLLKNNPEPDKYPCYKVVRSDGKIGGYSGFGGEKGKIRRLRKDGVKIELGRVNNLKEALITNFRLPISN